MPRYIDADALKPDYIVGSTSTNTECYRYVSLKQIVNTPTADVIERKRGEWEKKWHSFFKQELHCCSICGFFTGFRTTYCPNCGADMRKETEDDND